MSTPTTQHTPSFPKAGLVNDGWTKDNHTTATCFCGAVQLSFPYTGDAISHSTICHCADCRKITASMFASNFNLTDKHLTHVRGQDKLKTFSQNTSVRSGSSMTNHFCEECGSLMYRVSGRLPGLRIMRLGSVDDHALVEGVMRPMFEQFLERRAGWLEDVKGEGVQRFQEAAF
ncbi:Mss4-like protein [Phaeosphaeria sp. MPI-PUGE-AT-0046c]|nr:Mss4-like protein [Phaeosphaeria sp. MPI-PUGE-AT-0046c]